MTADGVVSSELAAETNAPQDRVVTMLKQLETDGKVRRSGRRRATRWHLVTDEDRVAARVAELNASRAG